MIAETLPFSYGKPYTSPAEYLRINPNIFSKTKNLYPHPKKNPPSKVEPKIIRNVKNLPKHLIGRVHTDVHKGIKHKDALKFGRPGCGAPVRTKSGRLKTIITGNPEIRFQNNESVQKTISNAIRYQTDRQEKSLYHRELDDQVKEKMLTRAAENQNNFEAAKHMEDTAGNEWGRPGPGGTYWRSSAVTGQGFYDKMGWSGSGDPRKREWEVKRNEAEDMKRDMSNNAQRRHDEHLDITSEVGIELVPLMKEKFTGNPRKDPKTGNMLSHGLSSTDVTKHADQKGSQPWHSTGNKQLYWDQLTGQVGEKQHMFKQRRNEDEEQQKLHFQSWESYWGRPGYGAPRNVTNKENLMKMLHYPSSVKNMPNNVELITLERLPVK